MSETQVQPMSQPAKTPSTVSPITLTANDPNTVVAGGDDDTARVVLPEAEDLTKRFGTLDEKIEGTFEHTNPNDPYFSAEEMSKRGPERHLPSYNFLGPSTEFEARMIGSDFYEFAMKRAGRKLVGTKPYNVPKNKFDQCAMLHDRVFTKKGTTKSEAREADKEFIDCIKRNKGMVGPMLDKVYGQVAMMMIKFKLDVMDATGKDDPFLDAKPVITVEDTKEVNQTIKEINNTAGDTQQQLNFWTVTLLWFFGFTEELSKLGFNVGMTTSLSMVIQRLKNVNIDLTLLANSQNARSRVLGNFLLRLASKLRLSARPTRAVSIFVLESIEAGASELMSQFLTKSAYLSNFMEAAIRFGWNKVMLYLIDEYFVWLDKSWKSMEWNERQYDTLQSVTVQVDPHGGPSIVLLNRFPYVENLLRNPPDGIPLRVPP